MNKNKFDLSKIELYKRVNRQIYLDTRIQNLIFVYCPPKVGSTSLVSSLRLSLNDTFTITHVHDETMMRIVSGIENITIQEIIEYNAYINKNVFVIDIYREPLERKMSEYFGKLSAYHFNTTDKNISTYSIDRIIERFNLIFPHIANEDHFHEKYNICDTEKNTQFDFEKKHICVKQKNNLLYLKLRLRDASMWPEILEQYIGKKIIMIRDYERNKLPLANLYNIFKQKYKIPGNFINIIEQDQQFQTYLSPHEQNHYLTSLRCKHTDPYTSLSNDEYIIYHKITDANQSRLDIETDHYFDEGCRCHDCNKMRNYTVMRLKNNQPPLVKIIHREVKEYIQRNITVKKNIHHNTLPINRFRR